MASLQVPEMILKPLPLFRAYLQTIALYLPSLAEEGSLLVPHAARS